MTTVRLRAAGLVLLMALSSGLACADDLEIRRTDFAGLRIGHSVTEALRILGPDAVFGPDCRVVPGVPRKTGVYVEKSRGAWSSHLMAVIGPHDVIAVELALQRLDTPVSAAACHRLRDGALASIARDFRTVGKPLPRTEFLGSVERTSMALSTPPPDPDIEVTSDYTASRRQCDIVVRLSQ